MLSDGVGGFAEGAAWIATLADRILPASTRWGIDIEGLFIDEVRCVWAASCQPSSGAPAVLKIGFRNPYALPEIDGPAFWDADPAVQLKGGTRSRAEC